MKTHFTLIQRLIYSDYIQLTQKKMYKNTLKLSLIFQMLGFNKTQTVFTPLQPKSLSYFHLSCSSSLMIISSYPNVAFPASQYWRNCRLCQDGVSVDRWAFLMAPVSGRDETAPSSTSSILQLPISIPCVSGEALQISVKRREVKSKEEKERYKHLNAEFQRIARRDKKAFLSDQCKEIEQNNRMERLEIFSRKLELLREHFTQRWAQ